MEFNVVFLVFVMGPLFYFLPSVIASTRKARYSGSIFLTNLLLGWTILGWIAALVWAIAEQTQAPRTRTRTRLSEPFYS